MKWDSSQNIRIQVAEADEEDTKDEEVANKSVEEKVNHLEMSEEKYHVKLDENQSNKNLEPKDDGDNNRKPLAYYLYKNFCPCLIIMTVLFLLVAALATVLGVVLAALSKSLKIFYRVQVYSLYYF